MQKSEKNINLQYIINENNLEIQKSNMGSNQIINLNLNYGLLFDKIPKKSNVTVFNSSNSSYVNDNKSSSIQKKQYQKSVFTIEEDNMLLSLVDKFGDNKWSLISSIMKQNNYDRNIRQCKDRYFHYLDPKINNNLNWTENDDELLLKFVQKYGKKWKLCENFFPGRTEVSIRNRYQLINRKIVRAEKIKVRKQINSLQQNYIKTCKSIINNYIKNESKSTKNSKNDKRTNDIANESKKNIDDIFDFITFPENEFDDMLDFDELIENNF